MAETVEDVKMDSVVAEEEPSSDSLVPDSAEENEVESAEETQTDVESVEKLANASADAAQTTQSNDRKCMHCSTKKPRPLGCENKACKKCCLSIGEPCSAHAKREAKPKPVEPTVREPPKPRKRVLKNEFKESNLMYYSETVTIFCAADYFANKKLCQGILNDQIRSLRVNGSYLGQHKKHKTFKDAALKAAVKSVLTRGPTPEAQQEAIEQLITTGFKNE